MFKYSAKGSFSMGGIFDEKFCAATGSCTILADSMESEECCVMVHGMEDGKVAIGGKLFTKLIDWWNLPIIIKQKMPNLKKMYLLSCFNGVRHSVIINDVKVIIPKQTKVNRPISISMSQDVKIGKKYYAFASGSKMALVAASAETLIMGTVVYGRVYGFKMAAKEMINVTKKIWKKYILAD